MRRSPRLHKNDDVQEKVVMAPVAKVIPCNLESITIGVEFAPDSEAAIESCVLKASRMHRDKKLGCGEQGCTFSLVEDPSHVIKVTKLKNAKDKKLWNQEACVGKQLGNLGIAPAIPSFFECASYGYIVMDILKDAKKLPDGTVIRVKNEGGAVDYMKRMPAVTQMGFVKALSTMIQHGFIHMDNHIENLGFIGNKPVVFDFGFTQKREFDAEDKLWALSFSLFQMIEHCSNTEMMCGPVWDIATAILRNDGMVKWDRLDSVKGMSLEELKKAYPKPNKNTLSQIKEAASAISPHNADIVVGAMCYAIVMQTDLPARYEVEPFYEVIYKIRTGKKF